MGTLPFGTPFGTIKSEAMDCARRLFKRWTNATWRQLDRLQPAACLSYPAWEAVRRALQSRIDLDAMYLHACGQLARRYPRLLRALDPPLTLEQVCGPGVGPRTRAELRRVLYRDQQVRDWLTGGSDSENP